MANPDSVEQEEPLDPAMERVRRKMVLLQLVSGGILFVCFMAGGFSVPADQPLTSSVTLPAGFQVQSVSLSGSQILFYGSIGGAQKALVFDASVGRIVADVAVGTAP